MQSRKPIFIILAIVAIAAVIAFFKQKNNAEQPAARPVQSQPTSSELVDNSNFVRGDSAGAAFSNTAVKTEPIAEVRQKKSEGLCRYFSSNTSPLLPWRVYDRINRKNAIYIILPSQHLNCLSEQDYMFKIIDYDELNDFAYNYYADIRLQLSEKLVIKSSLAQQSIDRLNYQKYGFENIKDLVEFLTLNGFQTNDDLIEFKIQVKDSLKWPDSSSNLGYFPGLQKVSPSEVNFNKTRNIFISTEPLDKNRAPILANFSFVDIPDFRTLIAEPKVMLPRVDRILRPLLTKEGDIYIHQSDIYDPKAIAIVMYMNAKFKDRKVQIIDDQPLDKYPLTPKSVAGLKVISASEFIISNSEYVFIDTRRSFDNGFYIRKAVNAPVYGTGVAEEDLKQYKEYNQTGKFSSLALMEQINSLKKKFPLASLRKLARGRKIVLYGQNDKDFSPLIFYESLRDEKLDNIYWLRLGLNRVKLMYQLNLIDRKFLVNSVSTESIVIEKENQNSKGKEKAKFIFLKQKPSRETKSSKKPVDPNSK
ncbi:MAG: hypothetical protein H7328_09575 [Bdellovibrio sp.]|nr:hypothetical protein [Bdellovibrio sp.]